MSPPESAPATTVIEPPRGLELPKLSEVREYRDLLWLFVRRDVAVRYKQTIVGAAWALLQPIILTVVFSAFLSLLFNVNPAGDIPYPLFLLCGLTMWFYFASATGIGGLSTLAAGQLMSKVYFPRWIVPLAAVVPPMLDFALGLLVLMGGLAVYGIAPSANIVLVPLVFLMAVLIALGASLFLSALAVRYRDVQVGLPFLLQILLYASAVIYPLSRVPESSQNILALNPIAGIMETFRWAVLPDQPAPPALFVIVPVVVGVLSIIGGLLYFQRAERNFVDVI